MSVEEPLYGSATVVTLKQWRKSQIQHRLTSCSGICYVVHDRKRTQNWNFRWGDNSSWVCNNVHSVVAKCKHNINGNQNVYYYYENMLYNKGYTFYKKWYSKEYYYISSFQISGWKVRWPFRILYTCICFMYFCVPLFWKHAVYSLLLIFTWLVGWIRPLGMLVWRSDEIYVTSLTQGKGALSIIWLPVETSTSPHEVEGNLWPRYLLIQSTENRNASNVPCFNNILVWTYRL